MMNTNLLIRWLIFLAINLYPPLFAEVSCVIAVVSSEASGDGRPILWQNLDSDRPFVSMQYFDHERYHFIGLVHDDDSSRVYAGLNTVGFGLSLSPAPADTLSADAAQFVKDALGKCGKLGDFTALFDSAQAFATGVSFACIDAYGGSAIVEANGTIFVAFDPFTAPDGFVVRSNFNLSQMNYADESFWRYHRARELFGVQKRISAVEVLRSIARDLVGFEPPAAVATADVVHREKPAHLRCRTGINNHQTVSGVVIHGAGMGEKPESATLWVILGEPICGVAVPLWPIAGSIPKECRGTKPALNTAIRDNRRLVYDTQAPDLLNLRLLTDDKRGLLPYLLRLEAETFWQTQKRLARWRSEENLKELAEFQKRTAADVGRKTRF